MTQSRFDGHVFAAQRHDREWAMMKALASLTRGVEREGREVTATKKSFGLLIGVAVLLAGVPSASFAANSWPATLVMQRGLSQSRYFHPPAWGTVLSPRQANDVALRESSRGAWWGVWRQGGGPPELAVRSVDEGQHWVVASPVLASDWVGGGIYYVNAVYPENASTVVIVSNAVIDLTTDGGRRWYQYVNTADDWTMRVRFRGGALELLVRPAPYATALANTRATYHLSVRDHRWRRVSVQASP
ncbi:MAG: hypothetical protein KGI14_02695 [Acidobacteriota bacterium]|nr:hypothetical protein [Acidobacteriota bacterium]